MMSEKCEEEDCGRCNGKGGLPSQRFSVWDMVGVAAYTLSGVAEAISDGFDTLSDQFAMAANWRRWKLESWDEEVREGVKRREIAASLRAIVEGKDS